MMKRIGKWPVVVGALLALLMLATGQAQETGSEVVDEDEIKLFPGLEGAAPLSGTDEEQRALEQQGFGKARIFIRRVVPMQGNNPFNSQDPLLNFNGVVFTSLADLQAAITGNTNNGGGNNGGGNNGGGNNGGGNNGGGNNGGGNNGGGNNGGGNNGGGAVGVGCTGSFSFNTLDVDLYAANFDLDPNSFACLTAPPGVAGSGEFSFTVDRQFGVGPSQDVNAVEVFVGSFAGSAFTITSPAGAGPSRVFSIGTTNTLTVRSNSTNNSVAITFTVTGASGVPTLTIISITAV